MTRDAAAPYLSGRAVSMFALSFVAAAGARIAWHPDGAAVFPLLGIGALLAVAMLAGEVLAPALAAARSADFERARIWAFMASIMLWLLGLVVVVGGPRRALLEREVAAFTAMQAFFLLLPGVGPRQSSALANALVLTVLAALRGGLPAAVATTCYLVGLGSVLFFDHYALRLGQARAPAGGLFAESIRQGAGVLGPIVLCLAVFFGIAPPRAHNALLESALEDLLAQQKMASAYAQLALVAAAGASIVYYASRRLQRRQLKRPPASDDLDPARGGEEIIQERPRRAQPRYEGTRGAIVRAYVRLLHAAAARGFPRNPHQTPRELALTLPAPRELLQPLTALFMDARYGQREPTQDDAAAAESAAREAITAVGRK